MATQPESRLQRRIRAAIEAEYPDSFWRKIHGGQFQAGIPDLVGCVEGCFFAFEVKTPTGRDASPLQKATMRKIRKAGGTSYVVKSTEEALEFIREALA